jgi:hypothetical protein
MACTCSSSCSLYAVLPRLALCQIVSFWDRSCFSWTGSMQRRWLLRRSYCGKVAAAARSGDAMLSDGPPQPEHFFQALESNPLSLQPTYFPIPAFNLLPELSKAVLNPLLPFVQIPYHGHEPAASTGELLPSCVDGIAVALLLHWPERSARVPHGFLRVLLLLLLGYLLCLQCSPNCSSDKNGPV